MVRSGKIIFAIFFLAIFLGENLPITADAQVPRKRIQKRINVRNYELNSDQSYRFSFSSQFSDLLDASTDSDLYDPRSITRLRFLKDQAQPWWDPEDIDPEETQQVVQKVLAIRGSQSIIPVVKRSDLKGTYRSIKEGYRAFTDQFKYSVQDQGDSFLVSNERQGEKLIELNLELDVNRGFDPTLNVGDDFRLTYDWVRALPMLEFEVNF